MSLQLFSETPRGWGFFVTVDGPNASGKTSIAAEIAAALSQDAERPVHSARQPSSSTIGALARENEASIRGRALACLVAADRHHQLVTEITPALGRGAVVVCDRYVESSLVLQRIDGVEADFILAVNSGIIRPNLRVRLVATQKVLTERLERRCQSLARRFESMPGGAARELELYGEADALLSEQYGLPSLVLDTSASNAEEQAQIVIDVIRERLKEGL